MKVKIRRLTNENKILIMLAFYSISIGLWGNFKQLWLESNQFSVSQISQILSLSTLFCAIGILIISKKVTQDKMKYFLLGALILKTVNLIFLYKLNQTNCLNLIQFGIVIDVIIETLITISIYPFICTIKKDDVLYSKRKLVEYLFKDIGILLGGMLIGKYVYSFLVDYNICLLISIFFLSIAFVILLSIKQDKNNIKIESKEKRKVLNYLKEHKLIRIYLWYIASGNIAMNTGLGLKMLMLTNMFRFSPSIATNYLLIIGLLADLIGILALKYLTPKNDYYTIFIKFGLRMIGYIIAFLTNNLIICLIAITWSILISTAYENRIDGQYINSIPKEYQLLVNNISYIVKNISSSIGLFFAGITYHYGIQYMLGLSAFFVFFQITLSNTLIYMKQHPKKGD